MQDHFKLYQTPVYSCISFTFLAGRGGFGGRGGGGGFRGGFRGGRGSGEATINIMIYLSCI